MFPIHIHSPLLQIPYVIMLFAAGLPVFFLEIAIGQYAGVGPIKLFGRLAPALRGVGFVSKLTKVGFIHILHTIHLNVTALK